MVKVGGICLLCGYTTSECVLVEHDGTAAYCQHYLQSLDQPTMVTNPSHGQLNTEKYIFNLPPFAPERLVSRDGFDLLYPASARSVSTLGLNLMLTHEISPAFRDGVRFILRQSTSDQSGVYQVITRHTDGVHCREAVHPVKN